MPNDGGDILPVCTGGEYLPALQARQKWQRAETDIRTGDVVLVVDENTRMPPITKLSLLESSI